MLITAKDEVARKIDLISFDYVLPDGPAVPKKNGLPKSKDTKNKNDEYLEGLRDYQLGQMSKLGTISSYIVFQIWNT